MKADVCLVNTNIFIAATLVLEGVSHWLPLAIACGWFVLSVYMGCRERRNV